MQRVRTRIWRVKTVSEPDRPESKSWQFQQSSAAAGKNEDRIRPSAIPLLARSLPSLFLMISSSRLWAIKNFARRRFANGHVMFIDDIHSVRKRERKGVRAAANVASLSSFYLNVTEILLHFIPSELGSISIAHQKGMHSCQRRDDGMLFCARQRGKGNAMIIIDFELLLRIRTLWEFRHSQSYREGLFSPQSPELRSTPSFLYP